MEECKNCSRKFSGTFCPDCGQKKNEGTLVLRIIIKDFFEKYWDFDAPFFRTVRELFISPAQMIKSYIRGKRKRYSHPIRYFIAILALFLVTKSVIGFDLINALVDMTGVKHPSKMAAETARKSFKKFLARPIYFFADHLNLFMLLFVFLFSGITRGMFFKSEYTYAEYMTLAFYVLAQYVLFSIGVVFLVKMDPWFYYLNFIFLFFYSIWVLVQFHKGSMIYRIMMSFYTVLISWLLYLVGGFFISQYIVTTFGM